jgi:ATP-dependent Clp protease ATP-binding subunit ClpA
MFEHFDQHGRAAVDAAQVEAFELGNPYIGSEHLLLGILADPSSAASLLLMGAGVDRGAIRQYVLDLVGPDSTQRHEPRELLATLGIDLDEIRRRTEATFGADALRRILTKPTPTQAPTTGGSVPVGPREFPMATVQPPSQAGL